MNDQLDPEKLARLLTRDTEQMDARILSALQRAREVALQKHAAQATRSAHPTLERWTRWLKPQTTTHWVAACVLAAVLVSLSSYCHHFQQQQVGALDVAILTDELPMEIFVD